jgi:NADH:ubiquinone oxidoreductase subunit K
VAQLIGIYGLVTRKADLIFSIVMAVLLVSAVILGVVGAYDRIH